MGIHDSTASYAQINRGRRRFTLCSFFHFFISTTQATTSTAPRFTHFMYVDSNARNAIPVKPCCVSEAKTCPDIQAHRMHGKYGHSIAILNYDGVADCNALYTCGPYRKAEGTTPYLFGRFHRRKALSASPSLKIPLHGQSTHPHYSFLLAHLGRFSL